MNRSEPALEARDLCKHYGPKQALRHLNLTLARGGVHAVVGSNGAGKSTLFRVLLGLGSPSSGTSRVLGVDSRRLDPETRGRVGLVNEEHALPGWMKVASLIALHRKLYPQWDDEVYRQVVGHFDVRPEQRVSQLSRGERAGVNLAMALAQKPDLLILDEPTLGLDVVAKQEFLQCLLFEGSQPDRTVVYCSHQMDEIERVADNLVILERGRLANLSEPDVFCRRISHWVTEGLPSGSPNGSIPGLLQSRDIEGQRHLLVIDGSDDLPERLRAMGAVTLHEVPVSLDRAVNAFLTRHHHRPATRGADHVAADSE